MTEHICGMGVIQKMLGKFHGRLLRQMGRGFHPKILKFLLHGLPTVDHVRGSTPIIFSASEVTIIWRYTSVYIIIIIIIMTHNNFSQMDLSYQFSLFSSFICSEIEPITPT